MTQASRLRVEARVCSLADLIEQLQSNDEYAKGNPASSLLVKERTMRVVLMASTTAGLCRCTMCPDLLRCCASRARQH
jgi:hypothetical protein